MWPFGFGNKYPYTDFHELNLDWILGKIRVLEYTVKNWLKNVTPTIEETVNEWLDDHPEATTTVQDGSITLNKLNQEVLDEFFIMTPDDFEGTDTEKLQQAFNFFDNNKGGIIGINREYNIEGDILIKHQTYYGINNLINVIGLGKSNKINMGQYSFKGYTEDYRNYGGVVFENIDFTGTATLFDFSHMVRINCMKCAIHDFDFIAYSRTYIQSLTITNSLIRDIGNKLIDIYPTDVDYFIVDTHLNNNLIERCNKIVDAYRVDGLSIENNCIEAFHDCPIRITGYSEMLNVLSNYFESNNNGYNAGDPDNHGVTIDLSGLQYAQSVNVKDNVFAQALADTLIILPDQNITFGQISIEGNSTIRASTVLIKGSDTLTTPYTNLRVNGNTGSISDNNYLIFPEDRTVSYTLTSANNDKAYVTRKGSVITVRSTASDNAFTGSMGWVQFGTLPLGFRPASTMPFAAYEFNTRDINRGQVNSSGVVQVYAKVTTEKNYDFSVCYTK